MIAGAWDPGGVTVARLPVGVVLRDPRLIAGAGVRAHTHRRGDLVTVIAGELYGDEARLTDALGADGFAAPDGAYAALVWDGTRGVLACDPLGQGALYVARTGRGLLFASELHGLLAMLDRTPALDEPALRRWLATATLPPATTLFEGVRRLAPGERLRLERDRASSRIQVWPPPPRESAGDPKRSVRDGVAEAVRRRCGDASGVLLSGGLDSTVIAAAAKRLGVPVEPAAFYAVRFPGLEGQDETRWIDLVTAELGLATVRVSVHGGSILGGMLDWSSRWRLPLAAPTWFYQRPVLERMAADGAAGVLDGEGGDELFAAARYLPADRLRAGRPLAAVRLVRRMPGAGVAPRRLVARVARDYAVRGALPLSWHRRMAAMRGAAGPGFDERWAWKDRPGPCWHAQLVHQLTMGIAGVGAHDHFRLRAAAAGLHARHPLLDLRLIETVLSLPPELAFDPVYDRPLLRAAMAGIAPEAVLRRTRKARFEPLLLRTMTGPDLGPLRSLLGGSDARVRAYIPLDVAAPPPSMPAELRVWADRMFRAASAECWLRELEDPVAAGQLGERLALAPPNIRFG